jgi:uncharacterized membrane protein YdbT with pleckstrin-like domain
MSYTTKSLINGEDIVFSTTFTKKKMIISYTLWMLVIAVGVSGLIGTPDVSISEVVFATVSTFIFISLFYIPGIISLFTTEYSITTKKILTKTGLIRRNTDELPSNKVEGIDVKQGIIGRIFNYGNVIVTGTGIQQVVFLDVDNPVEFKKTLQGVL